MEFDQSVSAVDETEHDALLRLRWPYIASILDVILGRYELAIGGEDAYN